MKKGEVRIRERYFLFSDVRIGVLFLRRKRPGFDPEWGKRVEYAVRDTLSKAEFSVFICEVNIVDDSSLRQALRECEKAGIDVLVVLQPTMSDGRLAPVLGQLWDAPIVLWATPERKEGSMISACSLVGTHTFASTLRQLNRSFELVYGFPGVEETQRQLKDAIRIAYTVRCLRRGKIGLVGYHAPGFIDMHADPFLMSRELGIQLHHFSLQEFLDTMQGFSSEEVERDVEQVLDMGLPLEEVNPEELEIASRYYLAMTRLIEEENLSAMAVRDWPELSDRVGQWPYLAMARLSSQGFPMGCEGDVDGAISCLIGTTLGMGVGYLSDWLEHTRDTVTLWHGGNAPFQLCEPLGSKYGPRIGRHFNNKKPAVVNANLKAGCPITVFRIWHCDDVYHMAGFNAETIPPERELKGTNGLAKVKGRDVHELFYGLCQAGMPHHVAVFPGLHEKLLRRFARQLNIHWVG